MAVTKTGICNLALIRIGSDRISDITQNTKSAVLLNSIYDMVRDDVLRAHKWNFATKRTTLAATAITPDWGYSHEFDLPNDCLRLLETSPDELDYVVEKRKIRANRDRLDVLYIYSNADESEWDSCFASAFAWKLAEQLAYSMTQSASLVQLCAAGYKAALAEARSMDGSEGQIKGLEIEEWTSSRR